MNQTATHQATYTAKDETNTIYFLSEADLVKGLDDWFSIDADRFAGEYKYMDSLSVTWGEVDELIFVCRCNSGLCNASVKKNGGFKPGHDAKLVSRLAGEVKSGLLKMASAHAMLADRPALQAKLVKQVG